MRWAIIDAVGAQLTPSQLAALRGRDASVRIHQDRRTKLAGDGGDPLSAIVYPQLVDADLVHAQGMFGDGVTVAVLDSGFMLTNELRKTINGEVRLLRRYDAITNMEDEALDRHGHGSHVSSIILNRSSSDDPDPKYRSIAPNANVVAVKAFNRHGIGSYADVIRGMEWILSHKDEYGIRIVNMSFSAPPQSNYWDDPLNQAVMRLWQAGIVVVAAAGNTGPEPMTVGVPGNVPYIITVGAMTDNYTPEDGSDDLSGLFSSAGPTVEGFVKPELVAPGGHMTALMRPNRRLRQEHPEFHDGDKYFTMSGTSQAAAVVSGIVALMLQANPGLTPDEVKCRLMASARPAQDGRRQPGLLHLPAGRRRGQRLRRRLQHRHRLRQPGSQHRQRPGRR